MMSQYLVAIYHPNGYDGTLESEEMAHDIDVLNDEMVAKGVRVFVGGLCSEKDARSLRKQANGNVAVTPGLYLGADEHIGGFWVIEAASLDEALDWGRKAVLACHAPVEIRPFIRAED